MEIPVFVAFLALLIFWGYQLVFLMLMEDKLFPGRFDKPMWVAVFVLAAPLAPFVFLFWRRAILAQAQDKSGSGTQPRQ
ncbi:MAG: hypothetical protein MUF04_04215 [Akkermansiaceae bacterium]|jgi:hypothetical protein|nr:hypothetical protein [Akkermansiaceae bacterium]